MGFVKRIFRTIAKYFVFVGGFLFIFAIGALYAFLRPEGTVVNVIFLLIACGWIVFLIKYFWDLMDKNRSSWKDD